MGLWNSRIEDRKYRVERAERVHGRNGRRVHGRDGRREERDDGRRVEGSYARHKAQGAGGFLHVQTLVPVVFIVLAFCVACNTM